MLVFSMLSLLCVVNNDIFKSVYFYVYTNARPPSGPCPPPHRPRAAPRYVPATRRFPRHISCLTCNATHDVAHEREVIVNHGECSVAMPAWVVEGYEIRNDRPHIPSSKCRLKTHHPTPPMVTVGNPQQWGKLPRIRARLHARKSVTHFSRGKVWHGFCRQNAIFAKKPA